MQNMCQRVSTADRHFFYLNFGQALLCMTQNDQKMTQNGSKWPKMTFLKCRNSRILPGSNFLLPGT